MQPPRLETKRLILRAWVETDAEPFAALNADPEVMAHLPALLTRGESDALIGRIRAHFATHGFGLWALETRREREFIGFTGLSIPGFEAPFTPCVEIGWRLARPHWGQGFASEAARRCLAFGFGELGLEEIVSFTSPRNRASIAVMERIGMKRDRDGDFDHPSLPEGDALRPHVLYRARPG